MCWVLSRLRASLGWQPPAPGSLVGEEQPDLWLNAETKVCICGCSSGKAISGLPAVKDGPDFCKVQITIFILFGLDERLWHADLFLGRFSLCSPSPLRVTAPIRVSFSLLSCAEISCSSRGGLAFGACLSCYLSLEVVLLCFAL